MTFFTRINYLGGFSRVNVPPGTHVVYCTSELLELSPEFQSYCEARIRHYVIDEADYFIGNFVTRSLKSVIYSPNIFVENGRFRPSYLWLPTFLARRSEVRVTLLSGSVPTPLHAHFLACWHMPPDTPTVACKLVRDDFVIDMIQVHIYLVFFWDVCRIVRV